MIKGRLIAMMSILAISTIILSACGKGETESTPTASVDSIQTQAVGTFSAALTQTALAAPSDTPFPTLTASATFAPFTASTSGVPLPAGPTIAPTASCYQLTFVSDVTIPDNTPMTPGQTFTKTWKVKNSGSCAWDAGFKFASTGGDAMSGATYTLPSSVPAGSTIDLSIAMVAPNKTGAVRGNWRMSTASGQFFGDEVFVVIVIGGAAATGTVAATNTSAAVTSTATQTPTATPTP